MSLGSSKGVLRLKQSITPRQSALIAQGIALQNQRRFVDAERLYQSVLRENPNHPDALNLMGLLAVEANQYKVALSYVEKAVKLEPQIAMYRNNLGNTLIISTRYQDALVHLRKAVAIDPTYAEAWSNLGKASRLNGDTEQAAKYFKRALTITPGFLNAQTGLAEIASETGQFEEAQAKFKHILILDPHNLDALCGLAMVKKYASDDPLIKTYEARLAAANLRDDQRAPLHHAFAKICNDVGRYDDAVAHFARGKFYKKLSFDAELHMANYAALKQLFTPEFFAERKGHGLPDERPVFVIGMPRSGTTLTEQILASHGSVVGLGELPDMRLITQELGFGKPDPRTFTSNVAKLSAKATAKLAQRYLKSYARVYASTLRVIDKSPHNYELLGLIALMFPRAHIIHCTREPIDNCVAIYMQNFSESHSYNKDFETLGDYYRAYQGLMNHWKQVLPLQIHETVYEYTVAELEHQARAMINFLGLDWDENCLNYHQLDRQVRTPSRWQVRQPIYSTSVERWRRYEKHLGPLKAALKLS